MGGVSDGCHRDVEIVQYTWTYYCGFSLMVHTDLVMGCKWMDVCQIWRY